MRRWLLRATTNVIIGGERVVWSELAKKRDANPRLQLPRPPVLPGREEAQTTIVEACARVTELMARAPQVWKRSRSEHLLNALRDYLGAPTANGLPPPPDDDGDDRLLDDENEARLAWLSGSSLAFLARWIHSPRRGVRGAVQIFCRMWGYERKGDCIVDRSAADHWRFIHVHLVDVIGPLVTTADDRAAIRALRANAPLPVRIGLARLLDDSELANEDARALLKEAPPSLDLRNCWDARFLMRLVTDVDLLDALFAIYQFDRLAFRPEIIARRIGVSAAPLLAKCLDLGDDGKVLAAATYLATLECAESARALAPCVEKKYVGAIAKELFVRRPDLAMPPHDVEQVQVQVQVEMQAQVRWLDPRILPPVFQKNGERLPHDEVARLTAELASKDPTTATAAIQSTCTAESLARWSWAVFETWIAVGADAADSWIWWMLGGFADDETAHSLMSLLKRWPKEVVDVLARLETAWSLTYIDELALSLTTPHLVQKDAQAKIEAALAARHLTREELRDRIIPTTTTTSAQLDRVVDREAQRLEQAMVTQREWTLEEVRTHFVAHPILSPMVRSICWLALDSERSQRVVFRIAEDGSLANIDDEITRVTNDTKVRIPHRLELTDDEVKRWREIFVSYELIEPFPQLSRELYERLPGEETAIKRFVGVRASTARMCELARSGWTIGGNIDDGWISAMKMLPLNGGVAHLVLEENSGYAHGVLEEPVAIQTLGELKIDVTTKQESGGPISRIQFSELIRDLELLRADDFISHVPFSPQ